MSFNEEQRTKVKVHGVELQPFMNWAVLSGNNIQSPDWWTPYNKVKHQRLSNYKQANLKNTINALAGLYILEQYFVKFIGDRDNDRDVPNDVSKLFEMVSYVTRDTVVGKDSYIIRPDAIGALF